MIHSGRIWAIVPAAGVGSRMGASLPKQYLPLADSCVLQVTLSKLLNTPEIDGVLVAIAEHDPWFKQAILPDARLEAIEGGMERAHSVLNGLQCLMSRGYQDDWALVHDAARPCVAAAQIHALIHSANEFEYGTILAARAADTLKHVVAGKVQATVDRNTIWYAHTPQIFRVGMLHKAIEDALTQGQQVTDESSAMELSGYMPQVLEDSRDNLKITQPEDLALAEWILQQQCQHKINSN